MKSIIELAKEAGFIPNGQHERAWLERYTALVRAELEWVDLTDDEIGKSIGTLLPIRRELNDASTVIAAFKEKNNV